MINDNGELDAEYFGAIGDGSVGPAAMLAACVDIWGEIQNTGRLARFRGEIVIEEASFPWRQQGNPALLTSLVDAKHGGIIADGPGTVFKTISANGADVFQLNGIKNFRVLGHPALSADVLGSSPTHGSNGCSVTGGFENLHLELSPYRCRRVDNGYADGGKGLSIQCDTSSNPVGYMFADIRADGCAEAFGFETDLYLHQNKETQIEVNVVARNCYMGVKSVAGAPSGPMTLGTHSGVSVNLMALNCQRDIVLNRAHGIDVKAIVKNTRTSSQNKLAPDGQPWVSSDSVSEALYMVYAKNARVSAYGNKGGCDHKVRMGGTSPGSSGLYGATEAVSVDLDLGGNASVSDFAEIDWGGNTVRNSYIKMSKSTASTFPYQIALPVNNNTLLRY